MGAAAPIYAFQESFFTKRTAKTSVIFCMGFCPRIRTKARSLLCIKLHTCSVPAGRGEAGINGYWLFSHFKQHVTPQAA
jgi:hypothetical protein